MSTIEEKYNQLYRDYLKLERKNLNLKIALKRIMEWKDLPWEYCFNYGSNGERDYYCKIAEEALNE